MSLNFYVEEEDIPQTSEIIWDNREFFNITTVKKLDAQVDNLLNYTDRAKYIDEHRFRDKFGYDVPWRGLSTGGMTVLNIFYNPDKVFSLAECGRNALIDVRLLTQGNVFNGPLVTISSIPDDCDIIVRDNGEVQRFTSFQTFREEGV
ncbi:hypothetical protein [Lacrimispora sp.]|uniref:hypothetical protein n=1 Tax=Lacrimispora sp. TaxID=2719234 RepID=UPI003460DE9B